MRLGFSILLLLSKKKYYELFELSGKLILLEFLDVHRSKQLS
jgi:hypothetical protein